MVGAQPLEGAWAVILGASSGFGEAVSLELAGLGMHIVGVHLDRKSTQSNVDRIVGEIKNKGRESLFFNVNAADPEKRREVLDAVHARIGRSGVESPIRVLLHSLAFGTLKPFITEVEADALTKAQMDMTLDVMANSLVYWTQDLVRRNLMGRGGRIFAMTSAGGGGLRRQGGSRVACPSVDAGIGPARDHGQRHHGGGDRHSSLAEDPWLRPHDRDGAGQEPIRPVDNAPGRGRGDWAAGPPKGAVGHRQRDLRRWRRICCRLRS